MQFVASKQTYWWQYMQKTDATRQSRLLSKLKGKSNHGHFLNCFNGFWTIAARDKYCEYCKSNGHVKVKISSKKEKLLKFYDSHYQFKIPFTFFIHFEIKLKPVDEKYREKLSQIKTEWKCKAPYTEKIKTYVLSGWCVHRMFADEHLDLLRTNCGKECVEKFIEHIEDEVKLLFATFPLQPITEITDVLKKEDWVAEKCHIYLKEFSNPENVKLRDDSHYMSFYWGAFHTK